MKVKSLSGYSLAGSLAWNAIDNTTEASIAGSAVTAGMGGVSLHATDDAVVRGVAGTLAVSWEQSKGGSNRAVAAGLSLVVNDVGQSSGHSVEAFVDGSTVDALGDVTIVATSTLAVEAYAVGGSVAVANRGSSASGAGLGAVALNVVSQTIEARTEKSATITAGN